MFKNQYKSKRHITKKIRPTAKVLARLRKRSVRHPKGFTLIELVLVIAILGVLAVTALPNFFNISLVAARTNAMNATAGSIQAGLGLYGANELAQGNVLTFPATLDAVADATMAAGTTRLFVNVVQNGINAQWYKIDATHYAFDTNGNAAYDAATDTCFLYTSAAGTFVQAACP